MGISKIQNILLSIIASCLVLISLTNLGIIKPVNKEEIPVRINSISGERIKKGKGGLDGAIPVRVLD